MRHPIKHFVTITKHRHQVIRNAYHMGIFFHSLKHDLSKYSPTEFGTSCKYYTGSSSPVYGERLRKDYFSSICQHHTRRNKHHWEYWTDFFMGRVLAKTLPYKYAVEYVCDVLAASKTYDEKNFTGETALEYFLLHSNHYYMTTATREFVEACLREYSKNGWEHLGKSENKKLYLECIDGKANVEIFDTLTIGDDLPKKIIDCSK